MTRSGTLLWGASPPESPEPRPEGEAKPAEPARDPRIGTRVHHRYEIVQQLGKGGVGVVFEGEHVLLHRRVAIKFLHPHYAQDPAAVARFQQEARTVTAIGHPNIVEALDMGTLEDGSAFVVFEHLSGRDLAAEIEARGALPEEEVIAIALQICDAFDATHRRGIVHRDIKPENIFLAERDEQRVVKLLDFGISLVQRASTRLTSADTIIGTPHYLSPEQASGRDVDHRTDLHALGAVLFVALTGELPFDADTVPALMLKICTETPPPLRRLRPDVSPALEAIVTRLLAKQREQRFESAMALKAALLALPPKNAAPQRVSFETAETPALPIEPQEIEAPTLPQRRVLPIAALIAAVTLAVVSAVVVGTLHIREDANSVPIAVPTVRVREDASSVPFATPAPAPTIPSGALPPAIEPTPEQPRVRRVRREEPQAPHVSPPIEPPQPIAAPPPVEEHEAPPQGLKRVVL